MFRAEGKGAMRLPDGRVQIKVAIIDERTEKVVREDTLTGSNVADVAAQLDVSLAKLRDAQDDLKLSREVVGKVLARV